MMGMKKTTNLLIQTVVLILCLFGSPLTSACQQIASDNDGNSLFEVPTTNKLVPEVSLNNIGFAFTPFVFKKTRYYVMKDGKKIFTMDKSTAVDVKMSFSDNDDDILLVGRTLNIRPHFEIGIKRTIDQLNNPDGITYYTFNGSVFTEFQRFKQYDTLNKTFLKNDYKSWQFGAKVNWNVFFGTKTTIATNISYRNAVDIDNYSAVQDIGDGIYSDDNVTSISEVSAYIAPIRATNQLRISVANPWFTKSFSNLTIIPYYFVNIGEFSPSHNAGFTLTFLKDRFRKFYKVNSNPYSFETAFSLGLNLLRSESRNSNILFLSGTASFGKSRKGAVEKEGKTKQF